MSITPARVAAFLAALAGLLGAIAVPVANLDTHDTSAVIAGLATIAVVVAKWLDGQAKHEARTQTDDDDELLPADDAPPEAADLPETNPVVLPADEGDRGSA